METTTQTAATPIMDMALINRLIEAEAALKAKEYKSQLEEKDFGPLYEDLAKAQAEFTIPHKSRTVRVNTKGGGSYEYSYAEMKDITKATLPYLNKYGIFFSQKPRKYTASNGAPCLSIVTELCHKSGLKLVSESISLTYNASNPQDAGSVMSYLCRYSACQVLGVVGSDDDDANMALGHEVKAQAEAAAKPTPTVERSKVTPMKKEVADSLPPVSKTTEVSTETGVTQKPSVEDEAQVEQVEEVVGSSEPVSSQESSLDQDQENQLRLLDLGLTHCEAMGASEEQLNAWANHPNPLVAIDEMRAFAVAAKQRM